MEIYKKKVLNKGKHTDAPSKLKIGNKMSKDGSEIVDAFSNFLDNIDSNLAKKMTPHLMLITHFISNIKIINLYYFVLLMRMGWQIFLLTLNQI